ncbi:MAG: class I SAM-dependent methyltransferase [Methylobacteriaceae bacterium]|nr:class I SAM-dependent methyltransferase [Methylobacteriaceae bacterium]MBV9702092.1 class I SAM-dependent methyltransferase [Methylobacteriaceae bacterium]
MLLDREKLARFPHLAKIVSAQVESWPDHTKYLAQRFNGEDPSALARTEDLSRLVLSLTGDKLSQYCDDYQWMCVNFIEEEKYFRRHKHYRLNTFADAYREVYSNQSYMSRYVNGILLSQVFWHNHAAAMDLFRARFLPRLPENYRHLEVGPGHGLFLSCAAADPRCAAAIGWDVSASSIEATRAALAKLGIARPVTLILQDVLLAPPQRGEFDSAIISEVLEHLEEPQTALKNLHGSLVSGGWLFVNVPINSPAPDHIFMWREPDEIRTLVEQSGFEIEELHLLPMTGYSVERALQMAASISCVVFARRP